MDTGIHDIAATVEDAASVPDAASLEKEVQELFEQLVLSTKISNTLPSGSGMIAALRELLLTPVRRLRFP